MENFSLEMIFYPSESQARGASTLCCVSPLQADHVALFMRGVPSQGAGLSPPKMSTYVNVKPREERNSQLGLLLQLIRGENILDLRPTTE